MNESTEKLIRELADKLGTTAEHLWSVLIMQATISGITNTVIYVVWCALLVWGYRIVKRKNTSIPEDDNNLFKPAEWDDDLKCVAWAVWLVLVIISFLIFSLSLSTTISCFANPEYWALKQILK